MNDIQTMADQAYEQIKAHPEFPSPTGVALAILGLAKSEDCDIHELGRVVESDPAIASRVLRYVNSAAVGLESPVASLTQAIAHLGLRQLKWITLGVSLVHDRKLGCCPRFDYEAFWSESLACATAFRTLASFLGGFDGNEVFTYGLLSQIGRLALAQVYPERYDKLLATIHPAEPEQLAAFERQSFNLDHNELAARMIADWRLPEIACNAIRHQDVPESAGAVPGSPPDRLTRTLHLCGLIGRMATHPHIAHDLPCSMILKARVLGIPPEVTHHLFDQIVEEWQTTSQILDASSRTVLSLAEIYIQAEQLREAMAWQSPAAQPIP